jgi:hypothetical protein
MKAVMLPVVSGGMGHLARTATLGRALRRLAPSIEVEYLFDEYGLRPFNLDVARAMGLRPRQLPVLTRQNRDAVIEAYFGDADVVVDDMLRQWLPCRRVVPQLAWISIVMYPIGDELFGDWPLMLQADALIWPYAPQFDVPSELDIFDQKLLRTGPFLETEAVPDKSSARARLGLPVAEPVVVYAPRGFPFGEQFGHAVFSGVFGAVERLRAAGCPDLRLVLLAVGEKDKLRGVAGVTDPLPDWVRVEGVVPPAEALLYTRAADILVAEGTSTMHEGAALRTPLVLVPGPFLEALVVAQGLGRHAGAPVFAVELAGPERFAVARPREFDQSFTVLGTEALTDAFAAILAGGEAQRRRLERAHALVTSGGGAEAAARLVLEVAARRRRASADGVPQNLFRTTGPGFVVQDGEPPST